MKKKKKEYADDDGRTVCNMNVPGVPWYNKHAEVPDGERIELEKAERRALRRAGLVAGLKGVAFIAGIGLVLFLLMALWLMPK
ncbi:MAG: hypothetical protein LBM78_02805 [Clostridiales bacterium]|jgi:hypothetical protein|nr:hypothetical protein [Clostridiales bacterium]